MMKWISISVAVLLTTAAVGQVEREVSATDIGGFAGNRIDKNKEHYIKTFPIGQYIKLIEERSFTAWDWRQGEQPGKWLESAILTSARTHDVALDKEAHAMFERIIKSQATDGYVGITSQAVRTPEKPLRGMDAYELYFLQHALLTAYEVWKDTRGLSAARKLGDYFLHYIGPGKAEFWPSAVHAPENKGKILKGTQHSDIAGHSIHYSWEGTLLIDPMMRLYQLTKDQRYLDWCKWVVNSIDKWSGWDAYSNLDKVAAGEMPVNKIQPYVHAHTFQMNFLGLLRLYQATGDTSYLRKVKGAWDDIASRQLYITGGVSVGEHYERDHVRPLTGEMMETCATMSWMQLSQYLLDITGDPKYADAMERILWNQVFAEQTIDGDANRYFTPPNGYLPKGYFREPDCCMGSGHRLLSMVPWWIYARGAGGAIYVNQYIPSDITLGNVRISQRSSYPEDEKITISVNTPSPATFPVYVRIPSWCRTAGLTVNGKKVDHTPAGEYVQIVRTWRGGDVITLTLPMTLAWVHHDHYIKTSDRKPYKEEPGGEAPYALMRGPVVYALDDIWYKGDTADFSKGWMDTVKYVLEDPAKLRQVTTRDKEILGPGYEVPILLKDGRQTSIPIYPFANIGKWYRDPAHKPDSNAAAWTYAIWLKGANPTRVTLSIPKIFGDNMVLQRDVPVPVWGQCIPGSEVTVQFGRQQKKGKADAQGKWKVMLDPLSASASPATMLVATPSDTIRFRNILVGEVWLCSGQSNMEYSMRKNSKFEKAAHGSAPPDELNKANNPNIRIFLVGHNYSKPGNDIRRRWDTAAGTPLRDFSAPAYFFAKELYRQLQVPIGVISNAVPGSAIEPYLPDSGKFYKTMVRPLAPYALKGFCWYQGETNCFENDTIAYTGKMKQLIEGWRSLWEDPDLSFYFVQIAPYYYSRSNGGNQPHTPETEPAFWEAQQKALSLPHTGMVVTTDLVDNLTDLHPAYKWEIGRRLALWALAKDYKKRVECSGPLYKSMDIKGDRIEVSFSHGALISHDSKPLSWWEIAGADGKFVPAAAVIKNDKVVVVSGIKDPVSVRFGWNEAAQPNLYNTAGLPAMPFRAAGHPLSAGASAQPTEKLYLSGTGNDHTVDWQFFCTEGRHSGKWTTIPVPSNWELQGFGKYNYGLDKDSVRGHEKGLYKYKFRVPAVWKGRSINIVFDGSMTDTEVKINGRSAGAVHQGSFYRFKYDISALLRYGKENLLEVTVAKESANHSVNMAERHCDFWIFGGIFRPVYLEALPSQHISGQAIDAKADGYFAANVQLARITGADHLSAQVYSLSGEPVGEPFSIAVHKGDTLAHLDAHFSAPLTWTPESPHQYKAVYTLSAGGKALHTVEQRFGFRTVELRERDGIYVNGVRIKFKGVCRHSFWPSSGRTLSKTLSIQDVQLMKDMNINAVRMSHYPPDDHFLDVCDSLGLFVLDELTGWHHAYDTEVGSKLVKEMIEKDVNHPSIVIWDNGNEGGFNFDLDPLFDRLDIQGRPLIHPWAVFRHTDTQHYINYDYGNGTHLHGHDIVFPTEFLHGLYDGGHGAGLHDFWERMWHEPLSAGGFLWDFSDEAVVRTDRDSQSSATDRDSHHSIAGANSALDADGDHGPDGILGPYREKEGSYYAIREVWAPVKILRREITPAFDGRFEIENRWLYTNMDQCRFSWRLAKTGLMGMTEGPSGKMQGPAIAPGANGILKIDLPHDWKNNDILYLTAYDPYGREINTWSWPVVRPDAIAGRIVDTTGTTAATMTENDTAYILEAKNIRTAISKKTGLLLHVQNEKGAIPFTNGPALSAGTAVPIRTSYRKEGANIIIESEFAEKSLCSSVKWTMYPSGWLKLQVAYFPVEYEYDLLGVNFSYPEKGKDSVKGIRWMGGGPYRVWKNRMEGVNLGVWNKSYNSTITGQAPYIYPEFKGYFSNFYWMRLETAGQPVTVVCGTEDIFFRLFTPGNPVKTYNTAPPFPAGDISFMQGIPAIGTKSQKPEKLGPSGGKNMYYDYGKSKDYAKELTLYFDFSGK